MAKKKSMIPKVYINLWLLLLVLLGGYYLLFAPRDSTYSPDENRTLAGFPEITAEKLLGGDFSEEFETYLLDRFPGRSAMVSLTSRLESTLSFASHEEYLQIAEGSDDPLDSEDYLDDVDELLSNLTPGTEPDGQNTTGTEQTTPSTQPSQDQPEQTTETTALPEGAEPPIVEKPEASVEDYPFKLNVFMDRGRGETSIRSYPRDYVAASIAVLNRCAQLLPEDGKLMCTVVPESTYANLLVMASDKVSFHADWDEMVNGLGDNNVYAFDAAEILGEAIKREEYVYFRTDMHWTPYGSYLLYSEMAKQAGKTPCSYADDFDVTVEEGFRGTYYRANPGNYGGVEPDVLELLMPRVPLEWRRITSGDAYNVIDFLNFEAKESDRYTVYLGGPAGPWTYAECDNAETENCLVITDSYGLSFIPFLTNNYRQVHYYDPRFFSRDDVGGSLADMIEKYEIQDIYVVVGDLHSFDSSFIISYINSQLAG